MTRLGRGYPVKRIFAERTGFMPVTFDAAGTGAGGSGTNLSWTHTAAKGSLVLAPLSMNAGTASYSAVTFGGQAMSLLATLPYNNVSSNGYLFVYVGIAPGGTSTVSATVTGSGAASNAGNSASYINASISSVQSMATLFGTTASLSYGPQTVNCSNGMMAVTLWSCLGASARSPQTFSGGTKRFDVTGNFSECSTWLQDASASTTFSATCNGTSDVWASAGFVLSGPVPR